MLLVNCRLLDHCSSGYFLVCHFSLVGIHLKATPPPTTSTPRQIRFVRHFPNTSFPVLVRNKISLARNPFQEKKTTPFSSTPVVLACTTTVAHFQKFLLFSWARSFEKITFCALNSFRNASESPAATSRIFLALSFVPTGSRGERRPVRRLKGSKGAKCMPQKAACSSCQTAQPALLRYSQLVSPVTSGKGVLGWQSVIFSLNFVFNLWTWL